jgi:hypothetical protein
MSKKKKPSRMDRALLETTRDFHRGGLASTAELEKIYAAGVRPFRRPLQNRG